MEALLYTFVHHRIHRLADDTRLFVGHDGQPGQRDLPSMTAIGASKLANIPLRTEKTRDEFVRFRTERDAGLTSQKLLFRGFSST